jgi:hypothetical protein
MKRRLLVIALAVATTPCMAITTAVTPPPANKGAPPKIAEARNAEAARDDSAGLRKGTVEAVNVGGGTFHMYGQKMTFDPKRVKIFGRDGKPASAYNLRTGGKVRFTMDATDPMHRRVAVIYVE